VLDLGCGHATVTLLLSALLPGAVFVCVEAQAISADLARRNLALNGLEARASVLEGDLREVDPGTGFDVVTGTPPFMKVGSGLLSKDPQRAAARFEFRGGIEAYLDAAARAVAPDGVVSMLMDAAQDPRCVEAFAAAGLRLWSTTVIFPRGDAEARYRAYLGGPGAAPSEAAAEEVQVRDDRGRITPRWAAIRRFLRVEA
jgi:tRNA1(Val) A37 N6-methylase TrmN6